MNHKSVHITGVFHTYQRFYIHTQMKFHITIHSNGQTFKKHTQCSIRNAKHNANIKKFLKSREKRLPDFFKPQN